MGLQSTCYYSCCNTYNTVSYRFTFFRAGLYASWEQRTLGLSHNYSCCHSVTVMSNPLQPHGLKHTRLPCPSLSPRICSDSCPLSQLCHPTISSSVAPFSSCPQSSFPASGSFPMSQFFAPGGLSIRATASVFPMNSQGWFPLGLTGLVSLLSKGLSRVFWSIRIQKRQFFSSQPSLWSNSHIHSWLLEKP